MSVLETGVVDLTTQSWSTSLIPALLVALSVLMFTGPRRRHPCEDPPLGRPGERRSRRKPPPEERVGADEVASAMDLLAVALRSGCGLVEAVEHTARVSAGAGRRDLVVVAAALRWGVGDGRAWAAVDPLWSRAASALRLAAVSGVAPSSLLVAGADDLREAQAAAIEVAGARVGVRIVLPLGLAFLPAFVLMTVVPLVLALARQVLA